MSDGTLPVLDIDSPRAEVLDATLLRLNMLLRMAASFMRRRA
jgi:hypothetical protein